VPEQDGQRQVTCKCSFLEIYNETITDLLGSSQANLHIREDAAHGVYVEGLHEESVSSGLGRLCPHCSTCLSARRDLQALRCVNTAWPCMPQSAGLGRTQMMPHLPHMRSMAAERQ
jgi:hypothetical protein